MKKITFITALLLGTLFSQAQIKLGGKVTYGSDIESIGIGAKGLYEIDDEWDVSGELVYFFGEDESRGGGVEVESNLFTINADAHYNFDINVDQLGVYALGGLNIAFWEATTSTPSIPSLGVPGGESEVDGSEVGLNLGGGAIYELQENISLFSELKFVVGDFDQVVFSAGVLFDL